MARFWIGLVGGGIVGTLAYAAGGSVGLAVVVWLAVAVAIWFRVVDALWDGVWAVLAWAASGGGD